MVTAAVRHDGDARAEPHLLTVPTEHPMLRPMSSPGAEPEFANAQAVTLGPSDCRDVNRWWTIARSVTNVAHELKNALQVISGNVEMLQLRTDLDAVTERRLQTIAAQTMRAVETMEPLLGYARDPPSVQDRVDLHALASVALSFRWVSLGRAGIKTARIAPPAAPLYARIDPHAALQLLLNLLLEAERRVSGRPAASISTTVQAGAGVVIVLVEGRAEGTLARPHAAPTSGVADVVSAGAVAELTRTYGATLRAELDPDCIRFALTIPAPRSQPAEFEPSPSL
jgi:hypothetical protein